MWVPSIANCCTRQQLVNEFREPSESPKWHHNGSRLASSGLVRFQRNMEMIVTELTTASPAGFLPMCLYTLYQSQAEAEAEVDLHSRVLITPLACLMT